jgi:hypothetical protein
VNEHELERMARGLAERAAERLDVEATARAVVARLRETPAAPETRRVRWMRPEWLRIAAVFALLLGAGVTLQQLTGPRPVVAYTLADLHDLTAAELTQMLEGLDDALTTERGAADELDLDALTPAQLQSLLRSLET